MKVKLWNDGPIDWVEEYKGETYTIPTGGFIELERSKAVKIQSQFSPFKNNPNNPREANYKKLRIEMDPEKWAEHNKQPVKFTASDGSRFRTKEGLRLHEEQITVGGSSGKRRKQAG